LHARHLPATIAAVSGGALERDAIVGDRYRLHRRLGEGGMGFVWEASHVFTHARFALKFLKGAREEDRRRFQREVRAAAAVRHPNVIGVHDFVELPNGMLVIVMDLLEGETLGALLARERRLPLAEVAAIFLPVVSALEAAHAAGIVHRDLKPDNIFLSEKEGRDVEVKVLDFGVAKLTAVEGLAARTQALTGTGSMLGTPYYMAPEQIVSEKDLDARADIWSLGIVMYECLAGVRPTEGDNVGRVLKRILLVDFDPITKHCQDLPDDVGVLITKMLVGERDERTRDLAEVRAVLERHAAKRIPSYARPAPPEVVDAHADTVASPSERPEAVARGDTHHAVSMGASQPSRTRARFIGAGVVAVIAGAVALGFGFASHKGAPTTSAIAMPAPASEPTVVAGTGTAAPLSAAPSTTPAAAQPVASAPVVASAAVVTNGQPAPPRSPPGPPLTRRSGVASSTPSATASPLAAAPASIASAAAATAEVAKPPPGFAKSRKD
jgi:serine/threonine protein kinase